jgi:DNA-binding transcriptional LysR family regulator
MSGMFSLQDLRLIRSIGSAGTLTGAARLLKVDHSTAFRRLDAIERRLGTRLFDRGRDGYAATSAGEVAIERADRILSDVGELEQRLAGEDLRPSGVVRVTTSDTLTDIIAPLFARLAAENPAVTVELVVTNTFVPLTKREADIALRPAAAAPEGLVGRRLAGVATAIYAAPDYLARHRGKPLTALDWIGFEESLAHLRSARWISANIESERIVFRANSLSALRSAVAAGLGVAALPCYFADLVPALHRIAEPLPEMETSLWLLTHPGLRRVRRVRFVLDAIVDHVARRRALIEGREPGPVPDSGKSPPINITP